MERLKEYKSMTEIPGERYISAPVHGSKIRGACDLSCT